MSRVIPATAKIRIMLALTTATLWAEQAVSRFWPVFCACALVIALALLAGGAAPPLWLHVPILAAALAGIVLLTGHGLRGFTFPAGEQAERRLEHDSGLRHRPFAVLRDRPAGGEAGDTALWQRHRGRAAGAITRLRLRPPRPVLVSRDPYAMRAAAILLLAAALFAAGPQAGARLGRALFPGLPGLLGAAPPAIQAWVQPPPYTGLGPIFLPAGGGAVTLPAGSKLTISLTGGQLKPRLHIGTRTEKFAGIGAGSFQAEAVLTESAPLLITRFFHTIGHWDVTVLPNETPVAAWPSVPAQAGNSLSIRLPWTASQRWGVASLTAELRPSGHPELTPIRVRMQMQGMPKQASGAETLDFSADPYAGLTMTGTLLATDVSGQPGQSDAAVFTLPSRPFKDRLARAIADLRRRLALDPQARNDAAADLLALAETEAATRGEMPQRTGLYLNMVSVAALLSDDPSQAGFDEAEARLWTVALALDGALPDANSRALAEAREQLRRALDDHAHGRMSDKDLEKRLQTLREALAKRMEDIARQAVEQGALQKFDPSAQHLSSSAMDRAMRQMQQAAREGHMDEARQRMAELEKMLDQLQNAKILTQEQARQQAERAKQGRKQLGAVQDLVRRETGLLDHAQARTPPATPSMRQNFPGLDAMPPGATEDPAEQGQPAPEPGPSLSGLGDQARQTDTRTQNALHRALGALQQALRDSGAPATKTLDQAGQAMGDAANALSGQDDRAAAQSIGRAIAALQQGGKDMAKQMQSQGGGQMQLSLQPGGAQNPGNADGDGQGEGQDGGGRDPLGRRLDGNGEAGDDPTLRVPDSMEQARSRAIQEELRRRGADRQRPQPELDYIDRLLKPF